MYHLGIDWGTHSSKVYSFDSENGRYKLGKMSNSNMYYNRQKNVIVFSEPINNSFVANHFPIKRQMITNPYVSFWKGESDDTNLTLGASIVFSLLGLLREAMSDVGQANQGMIAEICFSFPNWLPNIDSKHDAAFAKFRQAARIAVTAAFDRRFEDILPKAGANNDDVQRLVEAVGTKWDPPPLNLDKITNLVDKHDELPRISYLPESMAAGLPYLLHMQKREDHAHRLLVVDIGAGSTDIGYLTQWRLKREDEFHMVFFRPSPALGYAGESITDAVARQFGVSSEKAEAEKIKLSTLGTLGDKVPYVRDEWIKAIGERVREYVVSLPKHVLMEKPEPVKVMVTGGSGAIPGLLKSVLSNVEAGLKHHPARGRGLSGKSLKAVNGMIPLFSNIDVFETGRRSVSIGAGQPSKAKLIFAG